MNARLILTVSIVLTSCGTIPGRSDMAPPRPPEVTVLESQEDEKDRENSPDETAGFYLLKCTGGAPLSMDR